MQIATDETKISTRDLITLTDEATPWARACEVMAKFVVDDSGNQADASAALDFTLDMPNIELKRAIFALLRKLQDTAVSPPTAAS